MHTKKTSQFANFSELDEISSGETVELRLFSMYNKTKNINF